MKGERKLSLVKPPPAEGAGSREEVMAGGAPVDDLDLEATPEELREAEALRRSLERGEDPMAEALRAAFRPAPIDGGDLEVILSRALRAVPLDGALRATDGTMGDDGPATRIETTEADRLRATLEEHDALRSGRLVQGPGSRSALPEDSTAETAIALRAAWAPSPIGTARNDALVSRAVFVAMEPQAAPNPSAHGALDAAGTGAGDRGAAASKGALQDPPAPISLRRFRMGARTIATMTAVVAMAAGVLLMVGRLGTQSAPPHRSPRPWRRRRPLRRTPRRTSGLRASRRARRRRCSTPRRRSLARVESPRASIGSPRLAPPICGRTGSLRGGSDEPPRVRVEGRARSRRGRDARGVRAAELHRGRRAASFGAPARRQHRRARSAGVRLRGRAGRRSSAARVPLARARRAPRG